MSGRTATFFALCAILVGCEVGEREGLGRGGGPPATESPRQEEPLKAEPSKQEALESEQSIVELPVEGRRAAIVSLPVGANAKKPILVAAHGRDDVPQPLCEMWGGIVGDRAFVLCPTGVPSANRPGAFTYASYEALSDEIDDALRALRAKYPAHADDGPIVYSGFSLGSFQGVRVVNKAPERTPRVILIEGGHDPWNEELISSFADGGGQRVLFVTGQEINEQRSRKVASELQSAGIGARVVHAEGAGHVYTGLVRERIAEAFDWVVEGDDRWKK